MGCSVTDKLIQKRRSKTPFQNNFIQFNHVTIVDEMRNYVTYGFIEGEALGKDRLIYEREQHFDF